MDVVNQVRHHPLPGETIKGLGTQYNPGGKGANQAVAASSAGSRVSMIGALGEDGFGSELLASLEGFGVDTSEIRTKQGTSGLAFITVDQSGENCIILNEGANGKLTSADVDEALLKIGQVSAVLLQNEIHWEAIKHVIERANELGIRVYFNPAPALEISDTILASIHTLILNETEAEVVTGLKVGTVEQATLAAYQLIAKGTERVILTLGKSGALYIDKEGQSYRVPAYEVEVVDTTAAGDTFIGAFASACESGQTIQESLTFATAAAALTVTKQGAQHAIPTKAEILAFLREQG